MIHRTVLMWVWLSASAVAFSVWGQAASATAPVSAATGFGLPPAGAAKFPEVAATASTLQALRQGGYALYLRHGPTDNTIPDRMPKVDLNDCATQRPLTPAGRQLMATVGEGMRKAGIPIGEFRVSPLCRARESAAAAWPALQPTVDPNLMYVANFTDAEKAPIIANTRQLLSQPVSQGRNRLVLAHAPNLMDLIGYFPREGTLVIFKPQGNGFEYIASVAPTAWPDLLK
jgi:phosphohistidine phosphatase SixA